MAMLFGQKFTRSDLLQRVGNIFQVAGVRLMTLEDGWIYFIHGWTQVIGEAFNIDSLVKSLFTRHCEEQSDEAIS